MAEMTVIEAIRTTLDEELARDGRIFILGEDVEAGGVFRATEGLAAKYPGRVIDSPLAESSIVGVSIGAAHYGLRPIAEIQFADFIHAAFDHLCSEASRWSYRTKGDACLPMVVRTPWGGGVHGGQHHSQSIEAYYTHLPGIKVVAPAFPADYRSLLKAAIADPNPVLFLEHKRTYRLIRQDVASAPAETVIGRARVARKGGDLTIYAYGLMLHESLAAAAALASEGIEATVVDLLTLQPLDVETVLETAKATGKALIVHEDTLTGGFGGEIAALIAEHAFEHLDAPVRRLCAPDIPAMPYHPNMEHFFMPDREKIAAAARDLAAY
ncbi:MAG: alpha-ketoacid dehydrogenase subunit beta [Dehalococcoidia bacterium]|nr:alpha-ketoacid dehydrogenase subunit beta [Chloroflexi bacterium CFX7]MCK6563739.1 alpha-ketoacid dehydrogenase subunit beta [Dehalococcoidia bacterium]NUQ54606.1 alpha-ketoacid dehydrogenase subunit beta [Dehalococcoidia bacterium]RIL04041.1 MAG: alpha-ketoacid dehydrogenase subunit beta [bacterium]